MKGEEEFFSTPRTEAQLWSYMEQTDLFDRAEMEVLPRFCKTIDDLYREDLGAIPGLLEAMAEAQSRLDVVRIENLQEFLRNAAGKNEPRKEK